MSFSFALLLFVDVRHESDYSRSPTEVSIDTGSISSVEVVRADDVHPSTSGRRIEEAEADVSVAEPGEGVLTVVTG
ncbi:unnamed protein product [Prunus armeniaca]|uniref:Uncharacterized protein n=1 Tax=Prunus armeniaca TaxID=36596 RepID=A0A6J5XSE2_PRUAR|nr:unnamed protein product [Prunus armeniaca]